MRNERDLTRDLFEDASAVSEIQGKLGSRRISPAEFRAARRDKNNVRATRRDCARATAPYGNARRPSHVGRNDKLRVVGLDHRSQRLPLRSDRSGKWPALAEDAARISQPGGDGGS